MNRAFFVSAVEAGFRLHLTVNGETVRELPGLNAEELNAIGTEWVKFSLKPTFSGPPHQISLNFSELRYEGCPDRESHHVCKIVVV